MKNNNKTGSTIVTLLILLILGVITYFLIPKDFWDSVGSKNFKSPSHTSSIQTEGGPTPASLRFNDPFKYDKYSPSKKDEFLKKREENSKNVENKPLYWK